MMEMDEQARPENEGHRCPLCEFEANQPGFVASEQIAQTATQMQTYAREQGLIPGQQ